MGEKTMGNDDEIIIAAHKLKKYFPIHSGVFRKHVGNVKAVDGVTFSLKKGRVLGIVGESGSGKSTVARTVMRLTDPTAGKISFLGNDITTMPQKTLVPLRKHMQMIFQAPYASLNPRKTVAENIGESLMYHGIAKAKQERNERVVDILERVGLSSDTLVRYPHEFSGGQQQRICIGRAIALEPSLVICDEAVSALDVSIQAQILNLLIELKDKLSLSYLFISHDLSVVRYLCDDIIVMYNGKVVEQGPTAKIFSKPKHKYTQRLLEAIPRDFPAL
jgi:ABC-type oligopeptide transport system ATPase subunit